MKRIKAIGGSKVVWLAALIVAAAALAGGIGAASLVGHKGTEVSAAHQSDEATEQSDENEQSTEQEAVEGQGAEDGANHGHCVSWYAQKSKEDGLTGQARGEFMSTVASSDGVRSKDGTTITGCDFDSALAAAVAAQGPAVHGKSAEEHGKSAEVHGKSGQTHGADDADEATEDEPAED
jgi:hypothetical protein